MDGQTESIMAKTVHCIASYADALSKITALREHMSYVSFEQIKDTGRLDDGWE